MTIAATPTITCHAPHPQIEKRGTECGTVLVLGPGFRGDLTFVGVAKNQPETPLRDFVYLRCSRKTCRYWNVYAREQAE